MNDGLIDQRKSGSQPSGWLPRAVGGGVGHSIPLHYLNKLKETNKGSNGSDASDVRTIRRMETIPNSM
jgi:hypothetical protein